MVEVKTYLLPPTPLVPNSPRPLLHYPGFFRTSNSDENNNNNSASGYNGAANAASIHDVFTRNGWQTQWIFRYGRTQESHYHSAAHECMAVLSGAATIRFGVADTSSDLEQNTYSDGRESGGIEVPAHAGDVFVLPAGTAHKTFDATPSASFTLLTPGDAHRIAAPDQRRALADVLLSGFTMIGAYPSDSVWDFAKAGDHTGQYEQIWSVAKPDKDPVLGDAPEGLCGLWL